MRSSLVHSFLQRLFVSRVPVGRCTVRCGHFRSPSLHLLLAAALPFREHCNLLFPRWFVGWENHTSWPCGALCKIRVNRRRDESLKNLPAEWGAQSWLRGLWTKVLPGERPFLAYFGLLSYVSNRGICRKSRCWEKWVCESSRVHWVMRTPAPRFRPQSRIMPFPLPILNSPLVYLSPRR